MPVTPIQLAIGNAGGPAKVAALIGKSVQAVCLYRDGLRAFPYEHGAAIEVASGVKRWELWPDSWFRVWPELIGAEGAPNPEETRRAA